MRPEDGRKKGLWNSFRQQDGILPLCPDFVLELRSPSDRLPELQDKRAKYLTNESRLGWLIDPIERVVYVYRPGEVMERLEAPEDPSGEPILPGFVPEPGRGLVLMIVVQFMRLIASALASEPCHPYTPAEVRRRFERRQSNPCS
jgi:hypothetical protein